MINNHLLMFMLAAGKVSLYHNLTKAQIQRNKMIKNYVS